VRRTDRTGQTKADRQAGRRGDRLAYTSSFSRTQFRAGGKRSKDMNEPNQRGGGGRGEAGGEKRLEQMERASAVTWRWCSCAGSAPAACTSHNLHERQRGTVGSEGSGGGGGGGQFRSDIPVLGLL
jgi:hypothetical protein